MHRVDSIGETSAVDSIGETSARASTTASIAGTSTTIGEDCLLSLPQSLTSPHS